MRQSDLPAGYIAAIGRPGIGGEFLLLRRGDYRDYLIERHKSTSTQRTEKRKLGVSSLPSQSMVNDLLGAIEAIMDDAAWNTGSAVDIDDRGLHGGDTTLRERFEKLAKREWGR